MGAGSQVKILRGAWCVWNASNAGTGRGQIDSAIWTAATCSFVDLNRTGVALMEIVKQARTFRAPKKGLLGLSASWRQILRYPWYVCNGDMQFRRDACRM